LQDRTESTAATIRILAERWRSAGALLPAFPLLARGTPLAIAGVAQSTGIPEDRIERAIRSGRCKRDADGRLTGLFGLTLTPTLQRVAIEGRIVYSCCALWAHVIPMLVGRTAKIESVDPLSRALVRLTILPSGLQAVEPAGAAATLAHVTREAVAADVGAAFCSQVRHFVSQDSAGRFAGQNPARTVVTLTELQRAAEDLYRAIREASEP
jgi:alkylmercury lyase